MRRTCCTATTVVTADVLSFDAATSNELSIFKVDLHILLVSPLTGIKQHNTPLTHGRL